MFMKIKSLLLCVVFSFLFFFVIGDKANAVYSIEIQEAYYWALSKHITNITPLDAAELDWVLTRQVMAKIVSNFAINVLRREPDTSKKCYFTDTDIADWLLPHVITSCQLWLMGQWITKFNPYDVVTRAEFWTILSRILWWDTYDKWKRHTFYERHLQALNEAWIIKDINPTRIELRGYVFIMLMRTGNLLKEQARIAAEEAAKNATWNVANLTWGVITWGVITWSVVSGDVITWTVSNGTWTVSNSTWATVTWAVATWTVTTSTSKPKTFTESSPTKVKKEYITYTFKSTELVFYNADSEKIYWKLYKPNRDDKMPLVIYSHGLWSNYDSWIPYAEALAKSWVAVLLFDFRWGWANTRSEWASTDMSILTEKEDLETVLATAEKRSYIDKDQIFLWGASQGWLVSALVASSHSDVKWSILFFPAFSIPETVREMFAVPDDIPDGYNVMWFIVWRKYAADIWDLDVYSEIAKDEKPVLIVHWTDDSVVPVSYSDKAQSTYKNSTLKKIKWWGHWFEGKDFDTSVKYIWEFLESLWAL